VFSATRFLHENGVLLHYNDQLRGLNHLYFIDPSWVCDLIATLVTIRERNPFIMDGVMKMKDLELVLRDPKFPQEFIPQVKYIGSVNVLVSMCQSCMCQGPLSFILMMIFYCVEWHALFLW